jgi:beta-N-acetylhexosaminidase
VITTSTSAPAPERASCADPFGLSTWPLARRVAQLVMVSGQLSAPAANRADMQQGAGGVVFFGQPWAGSGPAIAAGMAQLTAAAGPVAPWLSTDEEGGGVARLSNVIGALPWPRQLAQRLAPQAVASLIRTHAQAMHALGINMDLAPVVDTANARNTVGAENLRSFSEDPTTAAGYGIAFANGLRAGGVVPVGKHFPGLGHVDGNTDTGVAHDPPFSLLQNNDVLPFRLASQAGVGVIMISHAIVPGLTGGQPASLSPATYSYLRQQTGFDGVAITDSLDAGAISGAGFSIAVAAERAIQSGADMVMDVGRPLTEVVQQLSEAVDTGRLPLARVDEAVGRILALKGVAACA